MNKFAKSVAIQVAVVVTANIIAALILKRIEQPQVI